jgi:hypothetical protein
MTARRKLLLGAGGLGGAVALAALLLAAATAASPGDQLKAVRVSQADAVSAVRRLAPTHAGLVAGSPQDGVAHRFYAVQDATVVATVDAYTGAVLAYTDTSLLPTSAAVQVSADQAQGIAASYLSKQAIPTDGLQPAVELLDHGDFKEYRVTWSGRANGALTPNMREVSVDPATGAVFAFEDFERPFATPPDPKLSPADAAAAARGLVGDPGASVTAADLAVAFDPSGAQLLVYRVHLTLSDGYFAYIQVDAASGAATMLGKG